MIGNDVRMGGLLQRVCASVAECDRGAEQKLDFSL